MKQVLVAAATALLCATASADYPDKPITIVVPFAAGGPTDKVARDLAEAMRKPLGGQSIVVENVGGAGGTLGATKVARAANDCYTLLLHHIGMSTAPALYRTMPYKTLDDFEYVGMINEVPMTLIGKSTLPANNFAELLKWMEANNGKINLTNTTGQIESGRVKAFAVTSSKRLTTPALKNLPTLDEAGLKGFNVNIWHGLYAPKGTPKAVIDKLNAALRTALKDPEFIKREEALGAVIITDARLGGAEHKK